MPPSSLDVYTRMFCYAADSQKKPAWRYRRGPERSLRPQALRREGHRATTTKEICRLPQSPSPLCTVISAPRRLFEMTVLEPFTEFIDHWITSWREFSHRISVQDLAESLVNGLFTLVRRTAGCSGTHGARADPNNDLHGSASPSAPESARPPSVQEVGLEIADEHHLTHLDSPATITSCRQVSARRSSRLDGPRRPPPQPSQDGQGDDHDDHPRHHRASD